MYGQCPECGTDMTYDKFKDVLETDFGYYTVEITYCPECGTVDDDVTDVHP